MIRIKLCDLRLLWRIQTRLYMCLIDRFKLKVCLKLRYDKNLFSAKAFSNAILVRYGENALVNMLHVILNRYACCISIYGRGWYSVTLLWRVIHNGTVFKCLNKIIITVLIFETQTRMLFITYNFLVSTNLCLELNIVYLCIFPCLELTNLITIIY